MDSCSIISKTFRKSKLKRLLRTTNKCWTCKWSRYWYEYKRNKFRRTCIEAGSMLMIVSWSKVGRAIIQKYSSEWDIAIKIAILDYRIPIIISSVVCIYCYISVLSKEQVRDGNMILLSSTAQQRCQGWHDVNNQSMHYYKYDVIWMKKIFNVSWVR